MTHTEELLGDFYTLDKGTEGGHLQAESGEGFVSPPELLRLDCVDAKSFLMETYVPQLVKIICKSVFLPLESTGGYQRVSFSTKMFLTDFILQGLCFNSIVMFSFMDSQIQGPGKLCFFFKSMQSFSKYDLNFLLFTLENISYNLWVEEKET